jgi:3-phosphoshikimate 1-carboxyvinyltransferase
MRKSQTLPPLPSAELPDILSIQPLQKPARGTVTIPGSKSITNRALILAALSEGQTIVRGALWAEDTRLMVEALMALGFPVVVTRDPAEEANVTIEVTGAGGKIPARQADLFVGNAGTAARFLTALVSLGHGEFRIHGTERMHQRPMGDLFDGLRQLGVPVEANGQCLPATVRADGLHGGTAVISARRSSQFASALLLIARPAQIEVQIAEPDEPQGYIEMTRQMLQQFSHDYRVEPDTSSASYFLAAAFVTGGKIAVDHWPANSLQMDSRFPRFLPPPQSVSRLHDLGDSVLTMAVCALFGRAPVRVTDASRLRDQECDRIEATVTELQRVGARAEAHQDGFTVWPTREGELHGADIETYNDHRIAMTFSVLGLKVPGIRIKNPRCVSKTFPNFFSKLAQLNKKSR